MTLVKFLFVLAVALPAAYLLFYFFRRMVLDFGDIKNNKEIGADYDMSALKKRRSQKFEDSRISKSSRSSKTRSGRTLDRTTLDRIEKEENTPKRSKRTKRTKRFEQTVDKKQKRIKREKVDHSRDTRELKTPAGYPKDPYADFRRPDLDQVIRNANERDRNNRKKF